MVLTLFWSAEAMLALFLCGPSWFCGGYTTLRPGLRPEEGTLSAQPERSISVRKKDMKHTRINVFSVSL
ncbi:MAG: hypothetical protein GXY07_09120 [Candidatus Hydrogenedentes bacterium]|nr:hypothetical protein [Candidatus Hydrogenedentota bacterium]